MTTSVRLGTPLECTAMDSPERRECTPSSSGAKLCLADPTLSTSVWRTAIMSEALIEQSLWLVSGKLLKGVSYGRPCSCMWRKMLTPSWTGKAAADSDMKWETNYPLAELLWLSLVKGIWVTYWNQLMAESNGRSRYQTKKKKSTSG